MVFKTFGLISLLSLIILWYVGLVIGLSRNHPRILNMTTASELMSPASQNQAVALDQLIRMSFEEQTCIELMVHNSISRTIRVESLFVDAWDDAYDTLIVNGTDPKTGYSLCLRNNSIAPDKAFVIPESLNCFSGPYLSKEAFWGSEF